MKPITLIKTTLFVLCTATFAHGENPEYASSRLTIPAVDAEGKPGFFQDVVIEATDNDLWRLVEAYEGVAIDVIEQVELIKTDSFPVQIFLKMSGTFRNGCGAVDQISHQLKDNQFTIKAYYKLDKNPGLTVCTQAMVPFTYTFALPIYGLKAGQYQYTLNDSFSGSFELAADNSL